MLRSFHRIVQTGRGRLFLTQYSQNACYYYYYLIFSQLTSQSIHIPRGGKEKVGFTFTIPFPCVYTEVHSNEIDEDGCPLNIELAVPRGSGGCESRLAGETGCGVKINPRHWNVTNFMKIIHQDTGNYELTLAEAERKIYLKTYGFDKSDAWKDVLLPVVNVNIYIFI